MVKFGVSALCVVGVLTGAQAQVTKVGGGYLFKNKFTVGKTTSYRMDMNSGFGGASYKVSLSYSQTVKSVKNGIATIEVTMTPPMMNGQPIPGAGSGKPTKVTGRVDASGKLIDGSQAQAMGMVYTAKPIPIGGKVTSQLNLGNSPAGGGTLNAVYTLRKITTYKGKPAAEFGITVGGKSEMKVSGSGTSWVSMADGSQLDSKLTLNVELAAGQAGGGGSKPMKIGNSVNITRIK